MPDYTTFELERMAAGEIDVPADAAERVAQLQRENEEVLVRYPADEILPKIRERSPVRQRRAPVILALAGIAAMLVVMAWPIASPPPDEPRVRLKGPELHLQVYKASPGGEVPLGEGDLVAAGDVIQARFGIAKRSFVAHYSIDGAGVVTAIEPQDLSAQTVAYDGGTHQAPTSTELDDAPQFERFVVVACDESFVVRELIDRVKAGTTPASCAVETVELRK